ncbi:MAG: hypothetical protein FWC82_02095, partial [Firmicutes bacterium]|nr:hypothetical protein [Bacillota bacterium]
MQKSKWNLDNSYIKLPSVFYTKQLPVSVRDCKMIVFNQALADFLNVPLQPEIFAGNKIPDGANPIAQAYAGH